MMGIGDIYVVRVASSYLGQSMINQYFYEQATEAGDTNAFGLFNAMNADILSQWVGCVSDNVFVTDMEVFQILIGSDHHQGIPSNNLGLRPIVTAALLPSSVAFSYRSNRAGAGTRRSRKRYSGIGENDVEGNGLSVSFKALAAVIQLAVNLGADVQSGANSIYKPVQVKATWKVGFPPVKNFDIITWDPAALSTQNSRKP